MQIHSKTILFSGIILILSCSPANHLIIGQIQNIEVKGLEGKSILCRAELEIENNYFLPFKIYSKELKLYASDQVLGRIVIDDPILVKARQKSLYTIDFKFVLDNEYSGIFTIFNKLLNSKGNYSIKGNIKARSLLVKRNIPVDMQLNDI